MASSISLQAGLACRDDISIDQGLGAGLMPLFIHDHRRGHIGDIDIQSEIGIVHPLVFNDIMRRQGL